MAQAGNFLLPRVLIQHRNALFVPSLIATLFMFALMKVCDNGFTNSHIPFGQVSLQLAFTETKARVMAASLTDVQRLWAYASIFLDYPFMAAYGTALCVSVLIRGQASDVAVIIASVVVIGVIFDAAESVFLYLVVSNPLHFHGALPVLVGICAILKFVLLGVGIAFIIRPFAVANDPHGD